VLFNIPMQLPLFIARFLPKTKTGYLNGVNLQEEKMKEAN